MKKAELKEFLYANHEWLRTIRLDRLQKVYDHMKSGVLGHKIFDYGSYNLDLVKTPYGDDLVAPKKGTCGTLGCAMGEFPIIFPNDFKFGPYKIISKNRVSSNKFLGIPYHVEHYLFVPNTEFDGLKPSPGWKATRKQVTRHIGNFLKVVRAAQEFV